MNFLEPDIKGIDRYLLDSGMQPDLPLARIHLRSIEGSSAERSDSNSAAPKRPASLAELLKSFLDKSRGQSARLTNLFPELKSRCNEAGIDSYDDHIDQLNLIFKLIFDDEDLPSSVTQQLGRLQIFIFITAIEEKNFLKRSSNPARRLLEGIINSEVEIAHSGRPEFSGIRYLREQLDKLTGHDSIPVERYSELLEGYRNFVSQHETETRRRRRWFTRRHEEVGRLERCNPPRQGEGDRPQAGGWGLSQLTRKRDLPRRTLGLVLDLAVFFPFA